VYHGKPIDEVKVVEVVEKVVDLVEVEEEQREPCMDQQQQVLKEYKKDADQDIVLWLNCNAEVGQSASKMLQCSCLPAPC
jgi:hypothetical protein